MTNHLKMKQKMNQTPPHDPPRHRQAHLIPPPPPRHPPPADTKTDGPTYDLKQWLNDPAFCTMVGRSMSHSLQILGLGFGASEMEIKVHYRQLACKYHPGKNDPTVTGLTTVEASDFFKLLNNANEYLKERQ